MLLRVIGFCVAIMAIGASEPARAQGDAAYYVVTYIEVEPAATDKAAAMVRKLAADSRRENGNLRFQALQRIERPNHFALVEAWKDENAGKAHVTASKEFRDTLRPMLAAAYDERPHGGLAVEPTAPPAAPAGAVFAITHVDFIPPKKDEGIAALKELVEPSRKEAGNVRYDILQQSNRPNHLTLVETWKDQKALETHEIAAHTKKFREQLLPMSGSLFDQRLYRTMD